MNINENAPDDISIKIRTMDGSEFVIKINETSSIKELKEKIKEVKFYYIILFRFIIFHSKSKD